MRAAFESCMYELMKENTDIVALLADSGLGKYDQILKEFPDRYIDLGIAESNMTAYAAALASEGKIPVIYGQCSFLAYRAFEFVRDDVCIDKRNVKIVGWGAGVAQNTLGPTHHALEDIAVMRVLPGMTILSPCSPKEVKPAFLAAVKWNGPVYLRLDFAFETEVYDGEPPEFTIGKNNILMEGNDMTLFATGSIAGDACLAVKELQSEGIGVRVVNVSCLKPLDEEGILREALRTGKVMTLEEHSVIGGLGSAVSEILARNQAAVPFETMGFQDTFCFDYGWHQDLKRMYGLSPQHIKDACRRMAGR